MTKYEDEDWDDLPEDIKEAAKVIGHSKDTWDNDKEVPLDDKEW